MVNASTFMLVISCCFSIIAIVIASRASVIAQQVPNIPKKLFEGCAVLEAQLDVLKAKIDGHCRKESSEKAVAARQAKVPDNGGAIAHGDYAALDAQLLPPSRGR